MSVQSQDILYKSQIIYYNNMTIIKIYCLIINCEELVRGIKQNIYISHIRCLHKITYGYYSHIWCSALKYCLQLLKSKALYNDLSHVIIMVYYLITANSHFTSPASTNLQHRNRKRNKEKTAVRHSQQQPVYLSRLTKNENSLLHTKQ